MSQQQKRTHIGPIACDGILMPASGLDVFCPPQLMSNEIHVWFVLFDETNEDIDAYAALLDDEEARRAARLILMRHRERFIRAHGVLRLVLAPYADQEPETLRFSASRHGKPQLVGQHGLHFNLSHSANAIAIAVARDSAIGIDIEALRPLTGQNNIAMRYFAESEFVAYSQTVPNKKTEAFYQLWTRKEAFLKATGLGLRRPLNSFAVTLGAHARLEGPGTSGWSLHHLAPGEGFAGALAVHAQSPILRGGRLDP